MNYAQQVAKHCKDLHPQAATGSDAVFAHQKELQRIIEMKKQLNLPAADEIVLWFELFEVWNELKALELKPELFTGGSNDNNSINNLSCCSINNVLVTLA